MRKMSKDQEKIKQTSQSKRNSKTTENQKENQNQQGSTRSSRTSVNRNREYAVITYLFLSIFIILMAYFVYFMVWKSDDFISSSYNPRLDSFSETIVRGEIRSEDGAVLAQTIVNSDGTETRQYPYGNIFAHVVGYSNNGKAGIESLANFSLLRSHAFFGEQFVNNLQDEKNIGDNVITTLDADVQSAAYQALGNYDGAVVVMQPSTGKIIAMVSKPDFDPNTIASQWESISGSDSSVLLNRATQGLYPPGSTFKILTVMEYIRETPGYLGYSYDCTGSISVEGSEIHCYAGSVHGYEDLMSSFAHSCNASFANIGLSLDMTSYAQLCDSLLFNQTIPFDLPTSKSSFVLNKDSSVSQVMQTAIGQGETVVTPLHMAMIASTICNDGTLVRPYLLERVENYNGDVVESYSSTEVGQLIPAEEAQTIQTFMEEVVNSGTGSKLSGQSYQAAGKTGTAEFSSSKDESHAWFVGYASQEGKEDIAVAVIVEDSGAGSTYAVPVAKAVFDTYFSK